MCPLYYICPCHSASGYPQQRPLTSYFHHILSCSTLPPPITPSALFISCVQLFFLCLSVEPLAPDMVLPSAGPPGLPRPKVPPSGSPPPSSQPRIFSPSPSRPPASWFQLLPSSSPGPIPFALPPAASADLLPIQPHAGLAPTSFGATVPLLPTMSNVNITTLATNPGLPAANDPWTRAHVRVCTHASEPCTACSISLICCSCRALRFTPGPPPASPARVSPAPPARRSRSASPTLFRTDVGNGSPPPGFVSFVFFFFFFLIERYIRIYEHT